MQQGNRFWTPFDLSSRFADFDRVSGFLHYRTVDDSLRLYPYYLPYGRGEWRRATPRGLAVYYQLVGRLGRSSQYFLHSLAGTFERRQGHRS
jgi:hypothetical protein